jgi:hypothetical protein
VLLRALIQAPYRHGSVALAKRELRAFLDMLAPPDERWAALVDASINATDKHARTMATEDSWARDRAYCALGDYVLGVVAAAAPV